MPNRRVDDMDEALRIHAKYINSDSDSGKSEFDEDYYRNKPPAVRIPPSQIVHIKPTNSQYELRYEHYPQHPATSWNYPLNNNYNGTGYNQQMCSVYNANSNQIFRPEQIPVHNVYSNQRRITQQFCTYNLPVQVTRTEGPAQVLPLNVYRGQRMVAEQIHTYNVPRNVPVQPIQAEGFKNVHHNLRYNQTQAAVQIPSYIDINFIQTKSSEQVAVQTSTLPANEEQSSTKKRSHLPPRLEQKRQEEKNLFKRSHGFETGTVVGKTDALPRNLQSANEEESSTKGRSRLPPRLEQKRQEEKNLIKRSHGLETDVVVGKTDALPRNSQSAATHSVNKSDKTFISEKTNLLKESKTVCTEYAINANTQASRNKKKNKNIFEAPVAEEPSNLNNVTQVRPNYTSEDIGNENLTNDSSCWDVCAKCFSWCI